MSNLQFQEPAMNVPLRLRSFYGRNIDQMQLLLKGKNTEGQVVDIARTPITIDQLLYDRAHGKNEQDQESLSDNYVDTGDVIIVNQNGEAIVGLYSNLVVKELVHSLKVDSVLQLGSLPVSDDQYQEIRKEGFVISSVVANELRNNAYDQQKAREGFWDYVARGNTDLVRDNLALVQKAKGGSMENRMGLWISKNPGMRLVCVGSVGGYSYAGGNYNLYGSGGRLVGVAAEPLAREYLESRLGEKVVLALSEGNPFEYYGIVYAPVNGVVLKNR